MLVQQILKSKGDHGVITVTPDTPIAEAASILAERRIGGVVVSADGTTADGILSERDIVRALAVRGTGCLTESVADVMTRNPVCCTRQDSSDQVLTRMTEGRFRHMPVVEDGKLVGYDIDLGEELAKRMGVKAKWTKIEFRGIIAGLVSKRVDMLVTAMAYTPERAERLTFSEPYFMTGVAAAYKPEMKVTSAADLAGKKIGVQIGTSGERYVRKNLADKVAAIQTYDEFLLAIRDLEAGRVDAVVNTGPTIAFNVKQRGNKLGVTANFDSRIIGVNTRKDDAALLAEVNKHILDMKKEGFLEKLDVKWFGRKMAHSPSS